MHGDADIKITMIFMLMMLIIVMMINDDSKDRTMSCLPIDTRNLCQGHDTTVTLRSSISRNGPMNSLIKQS